MDELENQQPIPGLPEDTEQPENYQNNKEDGEMPWDFPEVGTQEEEKRKRIKLYAQEIYFVRCEDVKMTKSKYENQYTGEYDINLTWLFKIIRTLDGKPVKYSNGEEADRDLFPVWTNVNALATSKDGKPQATRAIMTALMGLPSNAKIGKPNPNMFIGKTARVVCEIGVKKDGAPKQIWSGWAPWDGK